MGDEIKDNYYFADDEKWKRYERILLSWLGTPYKHMCHVKKRGVDCALLLGASLLELGVLKELSYSYYPRDWALHMKKELVLNYFQKHWKLLKDGVEAKELSDLDNFYRGDVLVYALTKLDVSNHVGIYLGDEKQITVLYRTGVIIRPIRFWRRRLRHVFRLYKK